MRANIGIMAIAKGGVVTPPTAEGTPIGLLLAITRILQGTPIGGLLVITKGV